MNIDKAKKRISKRIKMGFQGYPTLTIAYSLDEQSNSSSVSLSLVIEDGAAAQIQTFQSKAHAQEDESIQSAIVKMIERCEVKSVLESMP